MGKQTQQVRHRRGRNKKKPNDQQMTTPTEANTSSRRWWIWPLIVTMVVAGIVVIAVTTVPDEEESTAPPSPKFETVGAVTQSGTYELLETVPHDASAFTQGLITVQDPNSGKLYCYEGTGMYGESELRWVDIPSGNVLQRHALPAKYFGEGIAHYHLRKNSAEVGLIMLTWKEQTAFEFTIGASSDTTNDDEDHFWRVSAPVSNFTYDTSTTQGWGLTHAPAFDLLYVTDGSHYLHIWNATTRQEIQKVAVHVQYTESSRQVGHLNELEYDPITNTVLANVWGQDVLLRIDPSTGLVLYIYHFKDLFTNRPPTADVFNGIALTYDLLQGVPPNGDNQQVWVTGKYWPHMYRVRLVDDNDN